MPIKQTLALLFLGATTVVAQPFAFKGMGVGQPLSDCPAETVLRTTKGPSINCQLGPTTLANQPVRGVYLTIYEGRIASLFYSLESRGQYANHELRDALSERFGTPDARRSHLNEYTWRSSGIDMVLDGWKGHILQMDVAAMTKLRKEQASANKADL